jgi:hypothetical protein
MISPASGVIAMSAQRYCHGARPFELAGRSAWLRLHESIKMKYRLETYCRVMGGKLPPRPLLARIFTCGRDPRWKMYGITKGGVAAGACTMCSRTPWDNSSVPQSMANASHATCPARQRSCLCRCFKIIFAVKLLAFR